MTEKTKKIIGLVMLCVFTVMFIVGCNSPEVKVVFRKATNICLECIGIGG